MEDIDYTKMKVPELKKKLKAKGLSTSGIKAELIERLQQGIDTDDIEVGDDANNDDEDDEVNDDSVLDEDELLLGDLETPEKPKEKENKPAVEPLNSNPEDDDAVQPAVTSTFKAALITTQKSTETDNKLKSRAERFGVVSDDTKKQSRIERFGVVSADLAKQKRAERFGIENKSENKSVGKTAPLVGVPAPDADKLKKRAERFGAAVPSVTPADKEIEILQKRAQKFGEITSNKLEKVEIVQKAEKRKARFGTPITFESSDVDKAKKVRADRFNIK